MTPKPLPVKLADPVEFDKEFFALLGAGKKGIDAFNELNAVYQEFWGQLRYSTYQSYIVTKNKRLRR
jgi:hypothetical protein